MTVGQLLNSISSQELTEWRAYFRIENKRVERTKEVPVEDKVKFSLKGYKR